MDSDEKFKWVMPTPFRVGINAYNYYVDID